MHRVAVIIVNWNGLEDTLTCLSSLAKLNTEDFKVDIIVVDNGSTDDSVRVIQKKFPKVTMLLSVENFGFTGGNNRGIWYARGLGYDYIWLLNNDTTVDANALRELATVLASDGVGIAGSKIYFAPGKEFHTNRYKDEERGNVLWYAGGLIDWGNMYASHRGVDEVDHGQYDKSQETEFITGCSMMIKREVFEHIGVLDDRYFLYLEDLDFSLRAKRAGYRLMYTPASHIWHSNAGSTDGAGSRLHEYYQTRNRILAGFHYAPLRTRLALFRESLRFLMLGTKTQKAAVKDAFSQNFGKQSI